MTWNYFSSIRHWLYVFQQKIFSPFFCLLNIRPAIGAACLASTSPALTGLCGCYIRKQVFSTPHTLFFPSLPLRTFSSHPFHPPKHIWQPSSDILVPSILPFFYFFPARLRCPGYSLFRLCIHLILSS